MPDSASGPGARIAVIGGGIAGLATAIDLLDEASRRGRPVQVTVIEKDHEPGGNLRTLRQDGGWQLEWGPNGFLDNEPATLRLVERVGITDQLLPSSDLTRHRFLLIKGELVEIPLSPPAFIKSPLMPLGAKLRMAGEIFIRPRKDLGLAAERPETDETVHEFGKRRLGNEFAEVMLDPMVKGVFGGDSRQLSLAAAFPRMIELERDYGGLFKAMMALAKKRKNKTDAGPSGKLTSFQGGMQALISACAAALEADQRCTVLFGRDIRTIARTRDGWAITAEGGDLGVFDAMVHAAPAHAAAGHLRPLDGELGDLLAQIPFAPMSVIALGFPRDRVTHDLAGFGMLIPTREKRELLGALWASSIFPGRAPEGMVLVRCMAGGASNPRVMDLDDDGLVNLALAELRNLLGLQGNPAMAKVIRHDRAIAQYVPGHLARLKRARDIAGRLGGLFLTGSSYGGISVNSCCKEAETVAAAVIDHLDRGPGTSTREAS
ncbi:protoporphyrinogen oxidase [bacterium]|nr:protoporphyrinogen oxidase [bacterium]